MGGIKHHLQSLAFPLAQDGTLGAKANVATVSSAIDTCERRGSAVCFPWCHPYNMSDLQCHVRFLKACSSTYILIILIASYTCSHNQGDLNSDFGYVFHHENHENLPSGHGNWCNFLLVVVVTLWSKTCLRFQVFVLFVQVHWLFFVFGGVTWFLHCCERSCELFPFRLSSRRKQNGRSLGWSM